MKVRRPNLRRHRVPLLVGSCALGILLGVWWGMGWEWLVLGIVAVFLVALFWIDV